MVTQHTHTRRRWLALSAVVAVPVFLAGCGGAGSGGQTKLDVMVSAGDISDEQIAEFEAENPDIKVNIVLYDQARLNTMLASGNPPDITFGNAVGSANINARALATDLTPYLEQSEVLTEDDLAPVNDAFRWNGESNGSGPLYGLVKDWSHDNGLWYNTALFDEAGVPYLSETEPITYDELLDLAEQLAVVEDGTTKVYGLGMEWAWTLYGPISAMVESQGASLFNEDLTEIDFTTPEAQRALQWFTDYGQSGAGPTSLNPLPDGSDYSTFAAERMAISQDGYWFGGNFAADDALDSVRFAPAPVMGDEEAPMSFGGAGLWIPEKAKHKDEAWKFMEFYIGGKAAEDRASSGWGLPSLNSLQEMLPQEQPYQQQAYAVVQAQIEKTQLLPDCPYVSAELLQDTIDRYLQQTIKGTLSVEDAGEQLTAELNEAIKQGIDQVG